MQVDIFDTNNKLLGYAEFEDQDHIDIMPWKKHPVRVHNATVDGVKKYFIVVEAE